MAKRTKEQVASDSRAAQRQQHINSARLRLDTEKAVELRKRILGGELLSKKEQAAFREFTARGLIPNTRPSLDEALIEAIDRGANRVAVKRAASVKVDKALAMVLGVQEERTASASRASATTNLPGTGSPRAKSDSSGLLPRKKIMSAEERAYRASLPEEKNIVHPIESLLDFSKDRVEKLNALHSDLTKKPTGALGGPKGWKNRLDATTSGYNNVLRRFGLETTEDEIEISGYQAKMIGRNKKAQDALYWMQEYGGKRFVQGKGNIFLKGRGEFAGKRYLDENAAHLYGDSDYILTSGEKINDVDTEIRRTAGLNNKFENPISDWRNEIHYKPIKAIPVKRGSAKLKLMTQGPDRAWTEASDMWMDIETGGLNADRNVLTSFAYGFGEKGEMKSRTISWEDVYLQVHGEAPDKGALSNEFKRLGMLGKLKQRIARGHGITDTDKLTEGLSEVFRVWDTQSASLPGESVRLDDALSEFSAHIDRATNSGRKGLIIGGANVRRFDIPQVLETAGRIVSNTKGRNSELIKSGMSAISKATIFDTLEIARSEMFATLFKTGNRLSRTVKSVAEIVGVPVGVLHESSEDANVTRASAYKMVRKARNVMAADAARTIAIPGSAGLTRSGSRYSSAGNDGDILGFYKGKTNRGIGWVKERFNRISMAQAGTSASEIPGDLSLGMLLDGKKYGIDSLDTGNLASKGYNLDRASVKFTSSITGKISLGDTPQWFASLIDRADPKTKQMMEYLVDHGDTQSIFRLMGNAKFLQSNGASQEDIMSRLVSSMRGHDSTAAIMGSDRRVIGIMKEELLKLTNRMPYNSSSGSFLEEFTKDSFQNRAARTISEFDRHLGIVRTNISKIEAIAAHPELIDMATESVMAGSLNQVLTGKNIKYLSQEDFDSQSFFSRVATGRPIEDFISGESREGSYGLAKWLSNPALKDTERQVVRKALKDMGINIPLLEGTSGKPQWYRSDVQKINVAKIHEIDVEGKPLAKIEDELGDIFGGFIRAPGGKSEGFVEGIHSGSQLSIMESWLRNYTNQAMQGTRPDSGEVVGRALKAFDSGASASDIIKAIGSRDMESLWEASGHKWNMAGMVEEAIDIPVLSDTEFDYEQEYAVRELEGDVAGDLEHARYIDDEVDIGLGKTPDEIAMDAETYKTGGSLDVEDTLRRINEGGIERGHIAGALAEEKLYDTQIENQLLAEDFTSGSWRSPVEPPTLGSRVSEILRTGYDSSYIGLDEPFPVKLADGKEILLRDAAHIAKTPKGTRAVSAEYTDAKGNITRSMQLLDNEGNLSPLYVHPTREGAGNIFAIKGANTAIVQPRYGAIEGTVDYDKLDELTDETLAQHLERTGYQRPSTARETSMGAGAQGTAGSASEAATEASRGMSGGEAPMPHAETPPKFNFDEAKKFGSELFEKGKSRWSKLPTWGKAAVGAVGGLMALQSARQFSPMNAPENRPGLGGSPYGVDGAMPPMAQPMTTPPTMRMGMGSNGWNVNVNGLMPGSSQVANIQDLFGGMSGNLNVNYSDNTRDLTDYDVNKMLEGAI